MENKNQQRKIGVLAHIARESMPKLPYHNFSHAIDVYSAVNRFALLGHVGYEDRFLLKTAALLHDIVVVLGSKDNEKRSAEFTKQCLPKIGYSVQEVQRVGQLILATKMPQKPNDYLERLLCDADLDNLGRQDFFEKGEEVRVEFGSPNSKEWYQQQLAFLRNHEYHTDVARKLRNFGKQLNIQKLEKMLQGEKC